MSVCPKAIAYPARPLRIAALAVLCLAAIAIAPRRAVAEDRALLVVLDSYADAAILSASAGTAARDTAALEALLTGRLGFTQEQIKVLRDSEATREAILGEIRDWLGPGQKEAREEAEKARAQKQQARGRRKARSRRKNRRGRRRKPESNRSFLYFAGYGYVREDTSGDEADGFDETILPYDATVRIEGDRAEIDGAISDDEFSEALKFLEGRSVTVVLDTSHAGLAPVAAGDDPKPAAATRAPRIPGATRYARDDVIAKAGRVGDGLVEARFAAGSLTVWSAASRGETAVIDTAGAAPRGLFTRLYLEGLAEAKADRNGNGVISNMELLSYLREGVQAWCAASKGRCGRGPTPCLEPSRALGQVALLVKKRSYRRLSLARLRDVLVKDNAYSVKIEQLPPSPLHVGQKDIRFRVTSPHDGTLVLLNLTEKGQLVQLYPNQYAREVANGPPGRVQANEPVTVPESSYGLSLNATDPVNGHIIAIVTRDPVDFGRNVMARNIGDIPRSEAISDYLPKMAAALTAPLGSGPADRRKAFADWSVATLRYEILPKPPEKREGR